MCCRDIYTVHRRMVEEQGLRKCHFDLVLKVGRIVGARCQHAAWLSDAAWQQQTGGIGCAAPL